MPRAAGVPNIDDATCCRTYKHQTMIVSRQLTVPHVYYFHLMGCCSCAELPEVFMEGDMTKPPQHEGKPLNLYDSLCRTPTGLTFAQLHNWFLHRIRRFGACGMQRSWRVCRFYCFTIEYSVFTGYCYSMHAGI